MSSLSKYMVDLVWKDSKINEDFSSSRPIPLKLVFTRLIFFCSLRRRDENINFLTWSATFPKCKGTKIVKIATFILNSDRIYSPGFTDRGQNNLQMYGSKNTGSYSLPLHQYFGINIPWMGIERNICFQRFSSKHTYNIIPALRHDGWDFVTAFMCMYFTEYPKIHI